MSEDKLQSFIRSRRRTVEVKKVGLTENDIKPLPWYKRPIERNAFSYRKAKNGKFYVRHNEWSEKIWIGPYKSEDDVNGIIDSYITESLKGPLDRKFDMDIHSVVIELEDKGFWV